MSSSSKRKRKSEMARAPIPGGMAAAVRWPFYEVLVSQNWDAEAALITILVVRSAPNGKIAVASFLVDLACLGVKSAQVRLFPTLHDYDQQLRQRLIEGQPLAHADLNLAAKIIHTGLDYAGNLGFKPDPVCYIFSPAPTRTPALCQCRWVARKASLYSWLAPMTMPAAS